MRGELYAGAVKGIAVLLIMLGVVICVRTITLGGGPLSFGLIVGLALTGIGCARLWLAIKMGRR